MGVRTMSVNQATIMGNLGRDAEIRTTPGGAKVGSLSVATTRKWKDKDGMLEQSRSVLISAK